VYTPPEHRGRGYAQACVGELSRQMRAEGQRCMLFADLGNPVSNSIYRRLGYRAVVELLKYRFG
jgi:predicted GNAT family acetyltransferase